MRKENPYTANASLSGSVESKAATPQLINKQHLMDWLDMKANEQHYGAVYAKIVEIFNEVKSGRFDHKEASHE